LHRYVVVWSQLKHRGAADHGGAGD
jgi:hypothetical protein